MFGENIIVGESTAKIDNKNRIYLPSRTGAEIGDVVALTLIHYNNEVGIWITNAKKILELRDMYLEKLNDALTIEESDAYHEELAKIALRLNDLVEVQQQRRIQLTKNIVNKTGFQGKVQVIGTGASVVIRK